MIAHIREEYTVKIDGEPHELVFSRVPVTAWSLFYFIGSKRQRDWLLRAMPWVVLYFN